MKIEESRNAKLDHIQHPTVNVNCLNPFLYGCLLLDVASQFRAYLGRKIEIADFGSGGGVVLLVFLCEHIKMRRKRASLTIESADVRILGTNYFVVGDKVRAANLGQKSLPGTRFYFSGVRLERCVCSCHTGDPF